MHVSVKHRLCWNKLSVCALIVNVYKQTSSFNVERLMNEKPQYVKVFPPISLKKSRSLVNTLCCIFTFVFVLQVCKLRSMFSLGIIKGVISLNRFECLSSNVIFNVPKNSHRSWFVRFVKVSFSFFLINNFINTL